MWHMCSRMLAHILELFYQFIKLFGLNMYGIIWFSCFFFWVTSYAQKHFFFTIAADLMPLQPIEDEDDTAINFLYPLEPPVRFLLWVCFLEQYYLKIKNCFFIYRSYIICYISQRGGNIISREMNLEVAASATLFTPTMNLFTCHVEHV